MELREKSRKNNQDYFSSSNIQIIPEISQSISVPPLSQNSSSDKRQLDNIRTEETKMEEEAYSIAQSVMNMNLNLADISKHLTDHSRVIIQVYQAGNQQKEKLIDFISLLKSSFDDLRISEQNKNLIQSKLSSYLKSKDWKKRIMNLDFQEDVVPTQWPDFEPHMKATGAVAFYDLESNEIAKFREDYSKLKKTLGSNRQVLMKLFFIGVGEKERVLRDSIEFESHFCLVEDIDIEREACAVTIQKELENMIVDIAINMALEFEKLRSDPQNIVFVHMKEDKINDASKMKKRKEGRAIKMMGDLSSMLLSNDDSMIYFSESMKVLKKVDDFLWLAGCQCAAGAVVYAKILEKSVVACNSVDLEDEFAWRMREAISYISKTKFSFFFVEITFKFLKVLAELNLKFVFNEAVQAFEVVYTSAVIDKVEASQCFQQIALMYSQLGMNRKYGYYLRRAAQLINRENSNVSSKLMSLAAKAYRFYELTPFGEGKKSEEFWLTIQITFINEYLECLGEQTRMKAQVIRHVLNVFKSLEREQIKQMYGNLREMSPYTPSYDYFLFEQLPLIKKIEIIPATAVVKPNSIEKQGLFIYNPFGNKSLQKLKFPQDEPIKFKISLVNALEMDLQVDSIVVETTGTEVLNYPSSMFMSAGEKEIVIESYVKPLRNGNLSVEGVRLRVFNTVFEQAIDERGFGIIYTQRFPNQYARALQEKRVAPFDMRNITVLEKLPFLTAELIGEENAIIFEKSQKLAFQILLRNTGDLPITQLKVQACLDFTQPPSKEFGYSFEEVGEVKVDPSESFRLIFVEQGSTYLESGTSTKVLMLPILKQASSDAREITFTVSYMQKNDSAYLKEIVLRKRIIVKESISISSLKIIEQNQNFLDTSSSTATSNISPNEPLPMESPTRDRVATSEIPTKSTPPNEMQNFYLNDFFYLQVFLSKPVVKELDLEDRRDSVAVLPQSSQNNYNSSHTGTTATAAIPADSTYTTGVIGTQSAGPNPSQQIVAENRYTLTFIERGKTIDQCDLSETQSQRGLTKIFKINKTKLLSDSDESQTDSNKVDLNKVFAEMFSIKWKDTQQFSEGLLSLPQLDESVLQRILIQPITVTTKFSKIREMSSIQTYEGKYTVTFNDLQRLNLSSKIICTIEVLPVGETNNESDDVYFSVDGKTKFAVNLAESNGNKSNAGQHTSETNSTGISGKCEVNVYGLAKKKPYVFFITITDSLMMKQYNYQENILL